MPDETISLFIDLYLDADVSRDLAEQLRAEGFDAISSHELGHDAWADPEQMDYAIETQRAILTHNAKDFSPLARKYYEAGREHYGIILSEQLSPGELLRRTLRLLDRLTKDEMKNMVRNLGDFADRRGDYD